MITIRKIFLFVVLILFFACSEEKKMKEKGNLIVSKIENYRNKFGKVLDSLSAIGIKVKQIHNDEEQIFHKMLIIK